MILVSCRLMYPRRSCAAEYRFVVTMTACLHRCGDFYLLLLDAPHRNLVACEDLNQRLQIAEQSGNELRDGRMDVHRALKKRIGRAGRHDVEETMNRFVAFGPQQRGADYPLGFGVDQHLHEAL